MITKGDFLLLVATLPTTVVDAIILFMLSKENGLNILFKIHQTRYIVLRLYIHTICYNITSGAVSGPIKTQLLDRCLGAKGSYLTLVRVADRIL